MDRESFWHIRAAKYDKLYWTKDRSYLDCILKAGRLKKDNIVLDVGTGTGTVAEAIKPHVKHVVALDISDSMLNKGKWDGFSLIKWDIADLLFANNTFDKVIARMVFHHILDNLNRVILRCYDLLKDNGFLIVAEGVPPSDEKEVVDWYTHMFSLKEQRRTFTASQLKNYLKYNGFVNIQSTVHIMENFSIRNWLVNSGLNKSSQEKILKMHTGAEQKIRDVYNMKIVKGDCLVDTKNVIVTGQKKTAR
jgi:ubiquinone/menaquinone biosynthesis C-methylase UbiE